MNPLVVIALAGFLVFTAWSLKRMVSASDRQRGREDVWRQFAGHHGLEVATASGDSSVREITWAFFLDRFRNRFSRAGRLSGDLLLHGTVDGFAVRIDVVVVRGGPTSSLRLFTRCTVDVPGLPPELEIRTRGRLGRLLRSLGAGDDDFDRRFRVAAPGARAQEYLTSFRRAALVRFSRGLDALEVDGGKLFTLTQGREADPTVLDRRLSDALDLGRSLAGSPQSAGDD